MKTPSLSDPGTLIAWKSLISAGDLPSIQAMLKKGELSYKDKLGEYELSPLHLAAWLNQPEICRFLISQKISPSIPETFSGKTPLHIAAYFGHLEVAEALIDFGAKVDGKKSIDFLGCHPLHYAALGENEKMIFFFLGLSHLSGPIESPLDFGAKDVSCIGNTLDILIRKRNFALCDLVSSAEGISIVETNPRRESTLYVGYSNENPWTPFHSAAVLGEKNIVEMLLRKFPHAYCFSKKFAYLFDYSPGQVALVEGHTEVARMLGETNTIASCRQFFNDFSLTKNAPTYSNDLLKAIEERDFLLLDKLIAEFGKDILYQRSFCEPLRSRYRDIDDLNAFSIVARLFCASFTEWLKERKISVKLEEFSGRDFKETVFFHWSMTDIHPLATGFFEKIAEDLKPLQYLK